VEEGLTPLLNTPTLITQSKEGQRETLLLLHNQSPSFQEEIQRRVEERRSLSYISISPFPFSRGRGIKGDGVNKQFPFGSAQFWFVEVGGEW